MIEKDCGKLFVVRQQYRLASNSIGWHLLEIVCLYGSYTKAGDTLYLKKNTIMICAIYFEADLRCDTVTEKYHFQSLRASAFDTASG